MSRITYRVHGEAGRLNFPGRLSPSERTRIAGLSITQLRAEYVKLKDQGGANASKYRGVSWHQRYECWKVQIKPRANGKQIAVVHELHDDEEAAARTYDAAATRFYGA